MASSIERVENYDQDLDRAVRSAKVMERQQCTRRAQHSILNKGMHENDELLTARVLDKNAFFGTDKLL
jgi:hypothetical protein